MQERFYPAMIENSETGFGVWFPDLSGCVSAGTTIDDALLAAREALALHISGMIEDGERIPSASKLPAQRDPAIVAVAMVPVTLPGRKRRVNVSLDEGLLAAIDAVTDNRSGFLERAARHELAAD
ncbi:HicB family protein [Sphingorhabdus soli]|uniref:HicB family protein n=2 Tax=Flavisphingopyxis soli TaxID=2601267 RepID=A0A5C6U7H6_9SPHN|nr:HicB family protein [Sphingorhabdus soli]